MKTFSKFLKEAGAIKSIPAIQGRRLGLVPDGHGGYHDKKTGEFIAKSTNGKLKFYNQNQVIGGQDPKQVRTAANQRPVATQTFRKRQRQIMRVLNLETDKERQS